MSYPRPPRRHGAGNALALFIALAALAILAAPTPAAGPGAGEAADPPLNEGRHFDARIALHQSLTAEPAPAVVAAVEELRRRMPELAVTFDETTGAARSLYNRDGFLTNAPGKDEEGQPLDLALDFVTTHLDLLGLEAEDLLEAELTDEVPSRLTGTTHLYLRQTHRGIPVYLGQLQIHIAGDGRVVSVNHSFLPRLAAAAGSPEPGLEAAAAVLAAAGHLGFEPQAPPRALSTAEGPRRTTRVGHRGISREPITASLVWLPIGGGEARLAWNFQIHTLDGQHAYDFTVDANSAQVWTRFDWVASDSYRVYPRPVESPNHTAPPPPADARVLVTNPADATASPFGWHDTNGAPGAEFTIMRGNNVHAYDDRDANGLPPAVQPDCGGALACDFPINLTLDPTAYTSAAVANLFYWNNLIHDIQYQYGFDEASGNFQVNNYGHPGLGNDDVRGEAQDGGGLNNANFLTPPDGSRPRMQMYLWTTATPRLDGDLDSGVIVHEYGHGISNRLVGGPSMVSCLSNLQQPGEGLSDWWALAYTGEAGDAGTDLRGIGTYVLNQPPTGPGIRPQPYSTDPAINNYTYASVAGLSVPHGVGSVWAQAYWEVYWALVDKHGFDPDLYNAFGGSGNQRAMLYINEGLKHTICRPAFTDVRDGILQAAAGLFGGEDVCLLWQTFAAFGLGTDAVSGGPNGLSPTNGFAVPPQCQPLADDIQIVRNTTSGTNSPYVYCPLGMQVIGGGCSDDFTSTRLRSSWPITSPPYTREGWACVWEKNPGSLSAYAICASGNANLGRQVVRNTTGGTNSPYAICPAGKQILGGGCSDDFTSTRLRSSWPTTSPPYVNEGWFCVHETNPGSLSAYAICIDDTIDAGLEVVRNTTGGTNSPYAVCSPGKQLLSGGCSDDFTSTHMRSTWPTPSPPYVYEAWACVHVANPGSLSAYAICGAE